MVVDGLIAKACERNEYAPLTPSRASNGFPRSEYFFNKSSSNGGAGGRSRAASYGGSDTVRTEETGQVCLRRTTCRLVFPISCRCM